MTTQKPITLAKSENGRVWHVVEYDPVTEEMEPFCAHGGEELEKFNSEAEEGDELRTCAKCYDTGAHDKLTNVSIKFRGFQPKIAIEDLEVPQN